MVTGRQAGNETLSADVGGRDWRAETVKPQAVPGPIAVESGEESGDTMRIVCSWEENLRHPDAQNFGTMMQRHVNTGRPFGDRAFVRKLELLLGHPMVPGQPGRPRKMGK